MNILRAFGIGNKNIIKEENCTNAAVIKVTKFWWIKINRRAVRLTGSDGAEYPHMITFSYEVDGVTYNGKKYLSPGIIPPHIGETILVYYNEAEPRKYAVEI